MKSSLDTGVWLRFATLSLVVCASPLLGCGATTPNGTAATQLDDALKGGTPAGGKDKDKTAHGNNLGQAGGIAAHGGAAGEHGNGQGKDNANAHGGAAGEHGNGQGKDNANAHGGAAGEHGNGQGKDHAHAGTSGDEDSDADESPDEGAEQDTQ